MNRKEYFQQLISLKDEQEFQELALKVFKYQFDNNIVYSTFIKGLGIDPGTVKDIDQIPFLPVELFKSKKILTGDDNFHWLFTSSGTTGSEVSKHYLKDTNLYTKVFTNIFTGFYGPSEDLAILALLPSYMEREGSSLVFMMERLIGLSKQNESGFYLNDNARLINVLGDLQRQKKKTLLFGVTFALIDLVAEQKINFPELIVMETGGMKGRKIEMVRQEVHEILCNGFNVKAIHSEYGMTELLSQAYSNGNGIFRSPKWMRILIRDPYDPLISAGMNASGGINVIDLANIDSCAFIATQDLGKVYDDNSFEVLGRFDFSDIRGCNLLVG